VRHLLSRPDECLAIRGDGPASCRIRARISLGACRILASSRVENGRPPTRRSSSSGSRISAGRRGSPDGSNSCGIPTQSGCVANCSRSNARWRSGCICPSRSRVVGSPASCPGITAITRCPTTSRRSPPSAISSSGAGSKRFGVAASVTGWTGGGWIVSLIYGYLNRGFCIPGPNSDSPPSPKAGAQCGSPARWDLRGGQPEAMWTNRPDPTEGLSLPQPKLCVVPSGAEF
jgi:hypothetical protein